MNIDYLIVGQGIAGTLLSYELMTAGKSIMVLDKPKGLGIASLVAGAVINPAAGKNWTISADHQRFIPYALASYRALAQLLTIPLIKETDLYIFHESAEKRREAEGRLQTVQAEIKLKKSFNYQYGVAQLSPLYLVNPQLLLTRWRRRLMDTGSFQATDFEHAALVQNQNGVSYKGINAKKIIFCEGAAARNNPLFAGLPFTKNRGEALVLSIPELDRQAIYHRQHIRLVPKDDGLFWCGSNYQWNFEDLVPNDAWRCNTQKQLTQWLNVPFTFVDHIVAERPTTAGQFPLLGRHPNFPSVFIFNGLGTRGFSSGPFWAKEMVQLLKDNQYPVQYYDMRKFANFLRD